MNQSCPLCNSESSEFYHSHQQIFFICPCCSLIFLHNNLRLQTNKEFERYNLHQNNPYDTGYQSFVSPITAEIESRYSPLHQGLDFGSGKSSAISHILRSKNFDITEYDPFFANNPLALQRTYDYIACCEVIEHFYHPFKEFSLLYSLLKPSGELICMTDLYSPSINFETWYYKNDPTHVCIYTVETCEWITQEFGFSNCDILQRRIIFTK